MTNTGDFRRYSYQNDAAYALKAFSVERSSAAPKYEPQKRLKVRENGGRKSNSQLLKEQKEATLKVAVIMSVSVLVIAMMFAMLHTFATKNELNHEISRLQTQYAVAQSENTRINSELNVLVSMSMIDQYAVEKLNMTKVKSNQIRYIDVSQYKEERKAAALMLLEQTQE